MTPSRSDITVMLKKLREGNGEAAAEIVPLVYPELRRIARAYMSSERVSHTLQPTALIHEAWLRLIDQTRVDWRDRAHFFGVAATIMRRILVDYARKRLAAKRGSGQSPIVLEWIELAGGDEKMEEMLSIHEALERLQEFDPQQARIVEMRYFAGMDVDETASALGISARTVDREWAVAKAWLRSQLSRGVIS